MIAARRVRSVALALVAAYAGVAALVGCVQRSLLYHPPHLTPGELQPYADANRLLPWTNAAGVRVGWRRPLAGPAGRPAVLVVHGNAGSAAGREYIFDPLQSGFPCDVFVLEYPGFADRPGKPSQETLLAAGNEAMALLAGRGPVYLVGESLGTGVASYLAATRPAEVAGVVLLVPYNHLAAPAGYHYPWLPVRWILADKFPSDEWLPKYDGPVVVALGEADEVIPARFGRQLYDAYPGPKRLWSFPGEGHWEGSHRTPAWWGEAFAFLRASTRRVP